jgi:hypothetical protein
MSQDEVAVLVVQLHPEHSVRQGFPDDSFYLNRFFFGHINSFSRETSREPSVLQTNASGIEPSLSITSDGWMGRINASDLRVD